MCKGSRSPSLTAHPSTPPSIPLHPPPSPSTKQTLLLPSNLLLLPRPTPPIVYLSPSHSPCHFPAHGSQLSRFCPGPSRELGNRIEIVAVGPAHLALLAHLPCLLFSSRPPHDVDARATLAVYGLFPAASQRAGSSYPSGSPLSCRHPSAMLPWPAFPLAGCRGRALRATLAHALSHLLVLK